MNTNLTEIAFILDRSGSMGGLADAAIEVVKAAEAASGSPGSMGGLADAAIEGFNHFLREQQDASGLARLTLVLFDDEYLVPAQSLPVEEIVPLDHETYVPRNSTALLDAIGRTIDELGARLDAISEPERPASVIVAILTDGLENASQHYTWRDVAQRIRHQTDVYKWEFLFLGANQDAIATAAQLQIAAANAATYHADSIGHVSGSAALARKSKALRAQAAGRATAAEVEDAAAPMGDLLHEEDDSRRGKK